MKIAFFVYEFPKLSETFIINQITGLLDAGHDVDIFPYNRGNTDVMQSDVEKYQLFTRTYFTPHIPKNWLLRFLKTFWLFITNLYLSPVTIIRSLNIFKYGHLAVSCLLFYQTIAILKGQRAYDIIHAHFGHRGTEVLLFKELSAIQGKLLVSFHGMDANVGTLQERAKAYSKLLRSDAWYTSNTNYTKTKLIEMGFHEEKIFQLFMSLRVNRFQFRRRNMDESGQVNFLTIGRLTEKKGIEYSIQAFSKVVAVNEKVAYHIVGQGPQYDYLTDLVTKLSLTDKVFFHGGLTTEQIRDIADQCHIFVLASTHAPNGDSEGQGLVLQEAQAMGMPVIATDHNGFPEGVIAGITAFLVPERDIEALTERMLFLTINSCRWANMGRNGRRFVEEQFDVAVLTANLIKIYEQLLNNDQSS